MTSLKTAGQVTVLLAVGVSALLPAAMAQSSDTAAPRGLDFRLPPADDGRDSNVQGPSDNGLPPRQEPVVRPKAPTPVPVTPKTVTPPKVVVTQPKAATAAPKAAPVPAPKAAPKAVPAPAPVPEVVAPAGPTAPVETVLPPVGADGQAAVNPAPVVSDPALDAPTETAVRPEFLPSVTESEAPSSGSDETAPWWAWPLVALIALGAGYVYWRSQSRARREQYLEQMERGAEASVPTPTPAPKPAAVPVPKSTPRADAGSLVTRAKPTPAPVAPRQPAPVAPVPPRPAMPVGAPLAPAAPVRPAVNPLLERAETLRPQDAAAASVGAASAATASDAAPRTIFDEYVTASPLIRRPVEDVRADVEMDVAVRSIRIEADHVAVGFILTLSNRGMLDATGLMVRIALGQGSAMTEAVLGRFYDGAGGSILRDDIDLLAGGSEQLTSEVKLPRTSMEPLIMSGKPVMVPVLAADVTYHWDGEGDAFGQVAGAYVLGRASVGGSTRLAPIPLDRTPLAVDRPGARATAMVRRH